MTPNNIVNMAMLKELDVIALTDHNCGRNLPAIHAVAQRAGILFIPGIEVNTAEEVHMLAYFGDVEAAAAYGEEVYAALPDIANRPSLFGNQLVLDDQDEVTGSVEKLLLSACSLSLDRAADLARAYGGVPVPAHINREANSLLANLGFIPPDAGFQTVEVYRHMPCEETLTRGYLVLHSSDAHYYTDISERENSLPVCPCTRELLELLRTGGKSKSL